VHRILEPASPTHAYPFGKLAESRKLVALNINRKSQEV
jgi:hypothetical protein